MGVGNRLHSLPFISGDGFRQIADIIVDEAADAPAAVRALAADASPSKSRAKIVFCAQHHLNALLNAGLLAAAGGGAVVLILGNSDAPGPPLPLALAPPLVSVFAQNCLFQSAAVRCLPIGLANRHYSHGAALAELAAAIVANADAADAVAAGGAASKGKANAVPMLAAVPRASACFAPETYPAERAPLQQLVARQSDWVSTKCSREPAEFYAAISAADAVVSPRGNGLDTHRSWEALLLGRLLVTRTSSLDALWRDSEHAPPDWALPVLALEAWSQLGAARVGAAAQAARALPPAARSRATERLFFPFWACEIGKAAGRRDEFCSTEALLRVLEND